MKGKKIFAPWTFLRETTGDLAAVSLLLCLVSGVLLAIPYEASEPYASLALMAVANPFASLFRNLHYWSAQAFLILSLLHLVDYLRQRGERSLRPGMWIWLNILLVLSFFVMLTGFILKGDGESLQAFRILDSLLSALPFAGNEISDSILGREADLQLVYVHHIATGTIIVSLVVYAHIRRLWAGWKAMWLGAGILTGLSVLVSAPLHPLNGTVLKGPWYFLGLQEALHWMQNPAWSWLIAFVVILMLILLYYARRVYAHWLRYGILGVALGYLALSLTGFFFRGEAWAWTPPWTPGQMERINPYTLGPVSFRAGTSNRMSLLKPTGKGVVESCQGCHEGMSGFSPSHDPEAIGCSSCHLGQPFSANKDVAHRGMLRVPGNLDQAMQSCGSQECHPDITVRVVNSIMTTLNGMVAVNRFAFGESSVPDGSDGLAGLGRSAADQHFRQLCAGCHLGNPKTEPGPMDATVLGGGCNACHLQYSKATERLFTHWQLSEARNQTWPKLHPRLTVDIPDEKCFACHSRSGRISTNYQGWHETLMQAHEAHGVDSLKVLDDRRVFRFVSSDVHRQAGMRCVDCHISWELMGDGARYLHKEEQTRVQCTDCHSRDFTGKTENYHTDADLSRLGRVLNFDPDTIPMVVTRNGDYGLYNTRIAANGDKFLIGKADGKKRPMKPPASVCSEGTVHQRLDCAACHTAWAPSCIGCHNAFDERITAFDHLQGRFVKGGWEEYQGTFLADAPALGVWKDGQGERIITVVPGMVLTIDTASYSGRSGAPLFRRLFAPASAHTVSRKGRGCRECHNSPNALGYGRGVLSLGGKGEEARWSFTPRFTERMEDGLPEDAWSGFPDGPSGSATRQGLRSFTLEERRKILRVGACLGCHKEGSEVMQASLKDFGKVLSGRSLRCIDPGPLGGLP